MKVVNRQITYRDLYLDENPYIKFSIGIKKDAVHQGGLNLFGKHYGDSPQSLIMTLK